MIEIYFSRIIYYSKLFQQDEDTLIQIEDDSTHICCASMEKGFRARLREILLNCLNQF